MKYVPTIVIAILFAACTAKDKKPAENIEQVKPDTVQTIPPKPSPAKCYQYADASDTINLTVIHIDSVITGTLAYRLKEKDKNDGAIQGKMVADLLIADYTFMSEGVTSVRQVVFKLENGSFREGYGEIVMQNGKVSFKDIRSLKYDSKTKLVEYPCK